ncbi:MAG: sugar ABC transporter permease [Chloroflexi bacterium]|nr:sugar ABC transporter permease [Chloroflexota bacterium]
MLSHQLPNAAPPQTVSHGATLRSLRFQEALTAYVFLVPVFVGYALFVAGPLLFSLGLSLFEWDILRPPEFVGTANFERLLGDNTVHRSFQNTLVFVVCLVGLNAIIALALVALMQRPMWTALSYFYRSVYFLPVITSTASIAIVWAFLFHFELGIINYYLGRLGIEPVRWLQSSQWALWSIVIASVWKSVGFDFVIFLAGVQNIPRHLYEAAAIDGANGWQQFWKITLPMLTPTVFFAVVVGTIWALQVFDQPYIMTQGGPGDASRTVVLKLYEESFRALRFGYGSAIALALFAVIMVVTAVQFRSSGRWVHYQ